MPAQGSMTAPARPGGTLRHEPVTARLVRLRNVARAPEQLPVAPSPAPGPHVCPSIAFLADSGFGKPHLQRATRIAAQNGTSGATELLAHGLIGETDYYRELARFSGVPFVEPGAIVATLADEPEDCEKALSRRTAWCRLQNGRVKALFAPEPGHPDLGTDRMLALLKRMPGIAITTPSGLRAAHARQVRRPLGNEACDRLATEKPLYSAKHGAGAWHGFLGAGTATAFVIGVYAAPASALLVLHGAVTLFFLATVLLRIVATFAHRPGPPVPLMRFANAERPVYSIVVALHHEAPVVSDLVASLKALRWPLSKTEIKLVCEEGDDETLAALAKETLDRRFEIVSVPAIGPQTKPKALNYALPFCSGNFVTLYDAEDRPHPDQLEEAWQAFRRSDEKLAAVQAPLVIANPHRNWLTANFHLEYAALFRGVLVLLARFGLPVPLGGTSTHFRREAIEAAGRWDPYNVTEDADLGFRLWRMGYRVGALTRPTLEDAPDDGNVWLKQRTRWLKGWIQTWIVHSRRALRTRKRRDIAGAAIMHLLLAGTVACALFFPLTVVTILGVGAWSLWSGGAPINWTALAVLDWTNILLALSAQAALSLRTVDAPMRPLALRALPMMPVYWLFASLAGWRAVNQYFSEPFLWEKTPHRPHDPDGAKHIA